MRFKKLKLGHLGGTAEDGVTLVDEIEQHMNDLAHLCTSDLYGDKAKIDVTILVQRSGEDGVTIDAKVKTARPRRRRQAVMAYLGGEGQLLTQEGEQLQLPIKRKPRIELETEPEETEAEEEEVE